MSPLLTLPAFDMGLRDGMTSLLAIFPPESPGGPLLRVASSMPALLPAALLLTALCMVAPAHAQSDSTRTAPDDRRPPLHEPVDAEWLGDGLLLDESASGAEGERVAEYLENLRARPLDLNTASAQELAALPGLSRAAARRIVRHRATTGFFLSPAGLLDVDGISPGLYRRLRPFITVQHPGDRHDPETRQRQSWDEAFRNVDVRASYRVGRRLDIGRGYADDTTRTTFAGGPARHVARLDGRIGERMRVATALDKDPGEAWTWRPGDGAPGFDHVSGTAAVHDLGPVATIIAGDYTIAAGQGVGLWSGMAFGKGRSPTGGVLRSGRGLAPFASTEENRFFRGAAAVIEVATLHTAGAPSGRGRRVVSVQLTPFVSRRRLDASTQRNEDTGAMELRSRPAGGLHRTPTEQEQRDALTETVLGTVVDVSARRWTAGAVALSATRSLPNAVATRPDTRFVPKGRQSVVASGFAEIDALGSLWTGEVTRGPGGAWGGVAAWSYDDARRVETVVHGRYYAPGFDNPFSAGFSETSPQNESGLYAGARLRVQPNWSVGGYVDQYRFAWLRYNVPRPTTGRDVRLVVEHEPRDWLSHYVQIRAETKEDGHALLPGRSPLAVDAVTPTTRQSVLWAATYRWSDRLRFRTRVNGVRVRSGSRTAWQYGTLLLQDAALRPHPRLLLAGRMAFFDTDGFAPRVFAYERGVRYAFGVPALSGRGDRSYLLLRLAISDAATLEAKYGITRYDDRSAVGSGLAEVNGNRVREIDVQLHWRW